MLREKGKIIILSETVESRGNVEQIKKKGKYWTEGERGTAQKVSSV